jgi:hypothetical protein
LSIASPNIYIVEITITICSIKKHGVLVKLVITKIDIAKFYRFLISEFDLLLELLVRAAKRSYLIYYFLLKLVDFCYSSITLFSY